MWKWILTTALVSTGGIGVSLIGHGFTVGIVGFWPSILAICVSWAYVLIAALYYLEATLARPEGANIFTISHHYFGRLWAWLASVMWMLIWFGSLAAVFYLAPSLLADILAHHGVNISSSIMSIVLLIGLGGIFFLGVHVTLIVNLALTLLMGLTLYQCSHLGFAQFGIHYLKLYQWQFMILVFPTLITSMYYQFLIPTMASFLNHNIKQLRSSVVIASLIAASVFTLWSLVVVATLGKFGTEDLAKIRFESLSYQALIQIPILGKCMPSLSVICFITTTLGVGLVAIDFFADLLGYPLTARKGLKRIGLTALAIIPPYLSTVIPIKYIFNSIVYFSDFAGLFISGLLPILWIWALRYVLHERSPYTAPGGKITLAITTAVACFTLYLLGIEIIYQSSN